MDHFLYGKKRKEKKRKERRGEKRGGEGREKSPSIPFQLEILVPERTILIHHLKWWKSYESDL